MTKKEWLGLQLENFIGFSTTDEFEREYFNSRIDTFLNEYLEESDFE